jgi:DNA helicase-2/ATP-dependent DNA helicase PcrA
VAELLAEEDENGEAPLKVLSNGYRSTQQIIKYANQLLPSHSRHINSLQDTGEIPKVKKIQKRQDLPAEAVASATELLEQEPSGSVAIIAVSDSDITRELRSSGWVMSPNDLFEWQKESSSIRVLPPQRARGLEFDGVVVVEPGDFPENFGRQGVLYTALTRANKYLTITHCRALPKDLKKPT